MTQAAPRSETSPLRVGIVFDRFGDMERPPGAPADWDAEFEPEETIAALEAALERGGHHPIRIGNVTSLLKRLAEGGPPIDAAINIAESYGTRNREAHAPILLELGGIPFIGSDALALSATLDKHLTKTVARAAGIATPDWIVMRPGEDDPAERPPLPAMVKPRYEGTAKGIQMSSRCDSLAEVKEEVRRQHALYDQDVIVERFIDGAECTVAVVGHPPRSLPAMQRAVERSTGIGLHALEAVDELEYDVPGILTQELEDALQRDACLMHTELECRDFSRSDFRVDAGGKPWFIEINPLPTFAPDGTFAIIAEAAGQTYPEFLTSILDEALRRVMGRGAPKS